MSNNYPVYGTPKICHKRGTETDQLENTSIPLSKRNLVHNYIRIHLQNTV
jgi:hypothetical protein